MTTRANKKFITRDANGSENGYLVPIYNVHDKLDDHEPQQVYLTVAKPGTIKGPHLHYIRTGCFTCIKGNVRIVLKTSEGYQTTFSGEDYEYASVIIPKGVPAAIQNIGDNDAFVLNMPSPAWTPDMNDEHTEDFSDYNFTL
jgi:dTDP-4-dehydrorhamnose 3,5-epimerase-like enzyme